MCTSKHTIFFIDLNFSISKASWPSPAHINHMTIIYDQGPQPFVSLLSCLVFHVMESRNTRHTTVNRGKAWTNGKPANKHTVDSKISRQSKQDILVCVLSYALCFLVLLPPVMCLLVGLAVCVHLICLFCLLLCVFIRDVTSLVRFSPVWFRLVPSSELI